MTQYTDEIQEELRREDLFRYLKKALPYLGACIVAILIGAAVYSWRMHVKEYQLGLDAQSYQEAVAHVRGGRADEAQTLLTKLVDSQSSFKSLALLHLIALAKEGGAKQTMIQKFSFDERKALDEFLAISQAFDQINNVLAPSQVRMKEFGSADRVWYPVFLAWNALSKLATKDSQSKDALSRWVKEIAATSYGNPGAMYWFSRFVFFGAYHANDKGA